MTKTLFKISLRYGAVAGVLAFLLLLVMYFMGSHPMLVSPFLDFRILLFGVFIFFALREFRDFHQQGVLYFWQGLIGGFVVVLLASCIASLLVFLFGRWDQEFVRTYIEQLTVYLKAFPEEDIARIGKDVYQRNLAALPSTNIADLTQTYFMQGMMIGLFVNLLLSVILRRQPNP